MANSYTELANCYSRDISEWLGFSLRLVETELSPLMAASCSSIKSSIIGGESILTIVCKLIINS